MRLLTALTVLVLMMVSSATAGVVTYTSSTAFFAALAGATPQVEDYSSPVFSDGQDISLGSTLDGITYSDFVLTGGATQLDITNKFNSFSGLSLGADHTTNAGLTFFFGGEGATITFAAPVFAVGIFDNVNLNSGNYSVTAAGTTASTDSTAYDTSTFVFAGLISTTPFTSASFTSSDSALGSFNVAEIVSVATPEPSAWFGLGLIALALAWRRIRTTAANRN
ncbi:MAG TPA: PEP-CTERM sorting domain-containing protein [Bryobacteraceae bacterium]|nr:PEP-CTERM sorting domain-containing protein [Bryobacteraceae bacterium]